MDGAVVDRARMARSAAVLFAAGGVFAFLGLALPHPSYANEPGIVSIGATALLTAAILAAAARWPLPLWLFHAAMAGGAALISLAIYYWRPGGIASSVALLYVWVLLYAFYFFGRTWALVHSALVAASFAVVLALQDGNEAAVTQWIVTVGTAFIAGALIGWLVHQVHALAQTDALTGLPNRRAWEDTLVRELARARRDQTALCLAIADLDDFKAVNDRGGHQAGDRLLKEIAAAWQHRLRKTDFLARYGGDEFAMILPNCDATAAREVMGRLQAGTPEGQVFSVGIASWDGSESVSILVGRADVALYKGKHAGRSQVVVAPPA